MTREERENAIRCLKLWIEKEPYIQTYKTCLEALEQESCEDWYDVPSNEMNLEQARQAVKDLRKKLVEHLEQEPCEDAISRQAVMNYIHRILNQGTGKKKSFEFIQKYVANMPSVNPQKSKIEPRYCDRNICLKNEYNGIGCDECEVTKSQELCEDCISRRALLKLMGEEPFNWTDSDQELQAVEDYRNFRDMVEQLPSVKPQEPKTGHWIKMPLIEAGQTYSHECSLCGRRILTTNAGLSEFPYCHCGAKMVEPQESEEA